ncbi:hypothetical protein GCM10023347_21900 [Streptomyces chumphonensis]
MREINVSRVPGPGTGAAGLSAEECEGIAYSDTSSERRAPGKSPVTTLAQTATCRKPFGNTRYGVAFGMCQRLAGRPTPARRNPLLQ